MNDKKARALGINHVVLEVDDLDKALEFSARFSTLACAARANTTLSSILATSSFN